MLREAIELHLVNAVMLGITPDIADALNAPQRYTTTVDVALPWASWTVSLGAAPCEAS